LSCPEGASRLDRWLAGFPSVGSRRRASEVIETGKVAIGERVVTAEEAGLPVPAGATVTISWNRRGSSKRAAESDRRLAGVGLRILYEDRDVVAVDKPPGLLTDTVGPGQADRDSVVKRVHDWLKPRGGEAYVCHRIDRDTSGAVVLACNPAAHEKLREAFAQHVPERVYLAFVHGVIGPNEATWEDVMRWDRDRLRQTPCPAGTPGSMLARAHMRVVARYADATLIEVRLDTGRRNQIRLQASLRGHPLIGERIYLPFTDKRKAAFPRQALHAWKVSFPHPGEGRKVAVESPLPGDLAALRQRLEKGGTVRS
jgi:23S rRNA pseudouridine1911/1915/1917 synthase